MNALTDSIMEQYNDQQLRLANDINSLINAFKPLLPILGEGNALSSVIDSLHSFNNTLNNSINNNPIPKLLDQLNVLTKKNEQLTKETDIKMSQLMTIQEQTADIEDLNEEIVKLKQENSELELKISSLNKSLNQSMNDLHDLQEKIILTRDNLNVMGNPKVTSMEEDSTIYNLTDKGLPYVYVANEFGISDKTVKRIMQTYPIIYKRAVNIVQILLNQYPEFNNLQEVLIKIFYDALNRRSKDHNETMSITQFIERFNKLFERYYIDLNTNYTLEQCKDNFSKILNNASIEEAINQ